MVGRGRSRCEGWTKDDDDWGNKLAPMELRPGKTGGGAAFESYVSCIPGVFHGRSPTGTGFGLSWATCNSNHRKANVRISVFSSPVSLRFGLFRSRSLFGEGSFGSLTVLREPFLARIRCPNCKLRATRPNNNENEDAPNQCAGSYSELVPVYWALEVKGKLKWGQVNSSLER